MKHRSLRYDIITLLLLLNAAAVGGQVSTTENHSVLMNRKLLAANKVLEGIAREDFVGVERQAQYLQLLSQEAAWNVLQTEEYRRLSDDFRNTTTQLQKAAKAKNLDAVGLAFVKLSISCIDCHRHVKEENNPVEPVVP